MANLLTATLDDVARKAGDLYPITATLRANGAAKDLTAATVVITMVDSLTRVARTTLAACSIVSAAAGTVSYTPIAGDVAEGVLDVEFRVTQGGVASHFPSADYASLRVWPVLA
jgi:hypothetical protein